MFYYYVLTTPFSGYCLAIIELKPTNEKPFARCAFCGLSSVPVANYQLGELKFENAQKESFFSSPLQLLFLPLFFFCWAFTRKASFWWEKFLGKAFWLYRIRWKEVWVVVGTGTRFSSKFSGQLCMVFSLPFCLSPWLNRAHFGVAWKISSSCAKYWQSCPWPLELMTTHGIHRMWWFWAVQERMG